MNTQFPNLALWNSAFSGRTAFYKSFAEGFVRRAITRFMRNNPKCALIEFLRAEPNLLSRLDVMGNHGSEYFYREIFSKVENSVPAYFRTVRSLDLAASRFASFPASTRDLSKPADDSAMAYRVALLLLDQYSQAKSDSEKIDAIDELRAQIPSLELGSPESYDLGARIFARVGGASDRMMTIMMVRLSAMTVKRFEYGAIEVYELANENSIRNPIDREFPGFETRWNGTQHETYIDDEQIQTARFQASVYMALLKKFKALKRITDDANYFGNRMTDYYWGNGKYWYVRPAALECFLAVAKRLASIPDAEPVIASHAKKLADLIKNIGSQYPNNIMHRKLATDALRQLRKFNAKYLAEVDGNREEEDPFATIAAPQRMR